MISLKLSFYATLMAEFGQEIALSVEDPLNFFELFSQFTTKAGISASAIFLEQNFELKEDYNILLNGINIEGFQGLRTVISASSEVDFFTKIGGG